MRTAQLLRHHAQAQWPVLDEASLRARHTMGVSLSLDRRSLLVGPGPDSLAAVAAAQRSGRSFDLLRRGGDPALPLYLSRDGRSFEGPRVILEYFALNSRVAFRPPVGSVEALQMGQWLDWIDRAVAVPLSIERGLAKAPESTSEMGRELIRRIVDALEQRSDEIERSEFLVGNHRTIVDLYLWACLELLGGSCPASLHEYRDRTGAEAELGVAVSRFKGVLEKTLDESSVGSS